MSESRKEAADNAIAAAAREAVEKHADIGESFTYAKEKLSESPAYTEDITKELARRGLLATIHDARHAATERTHNARRAERTKSGDYAPEQKTTSLGKGAIASANEAWQLHVGNKWLWNTTGDELVKHEANEREIGDGHHKRSDLFKRLAKRTKGEKEVSHVYTKRGLQKIHDEIFGG